jgi:hypothetical protein
MKFFVLRTVSVLASFFTYQAFAADFATAPSADVVTPPSEEAVQRAAMRATPLSLRETRDIYSNHTWQWENGAGYYAAEKRQFKGWSGSGMESSYTDDGIWFLKDDGIMCMRATWDAVSGPVMVASCFEHRADDNYYYQRSLPGGNWYIFGTLPEQTGFEMDKLQPGERLGEGMQQTQAYIKQNAAPYRSVTSSSQLSANQISQYSYETMTAEFCNALKQYGDMKIEHPACS